MTTQSINIGGLDAETVYSNVLQAGISKSDAVQFIGQWLIDNSRTTARVFNYTTDFPATDTDCTPHFVRSFIHKDWTDGEDLVQAEQSAGEDGFNVRFHHVENDLDALAADTAEAFLCLGEMRGELYALLNELRLEINRINQDLANLQACCDSHTGVVSYVPPGKYLGTGEMLGTNVNYYTDTKGEIFAAPAVNVLPGGGGDPVGNVDKVASLGSYMAAESKVMAAFFKGGNATKESFVQKFGGDVTPDGYQVASLVDIIPAGTKIASAQELVNDVADRQAGAIRTTDFTDAAVAGTLGFSAVGTAAADAPAEQFQVVPQTARAALSGAGVATVSDLANANAATLAKTLTKSGVAVSASNAAGWIAAARTMAGVQ